MSRKLVAGLFTVLLGLSNINYINAQAGSIFGINNQRPSWEALAAMLGFTTNERRTQLEGVIDESTKLNEDVEGLIDRIMFLLKPVREVDATKSEDRLSLAKKTAEQHAINAQDISDRGDVGVQTMQEVSDFLLNTAQFLHTLYKKSPTNTKIRSLMNEVQKAHAEIDKLMAVTVTYALKANQAAYDATAAAEKVRQSAVLRLAIDNVMDAESAAAQAGEVAQAIMVNEQIAQATGEKYVNFFAKALESIDTVDTQSSTDVRNVLGQLLGTSPVSSKMTPKEEHEKLHGKLTTAVSRLRTLQTTARIYLEGARSAASDTKTLLEMLNSLRETNKDLSQIAISRRASLDAAEKAAKEAEGNFNSISIAVAIAEKVAERAVDLESMKSALETAKKKTIEVEKVVDVLRENKDLAETKKNAIFGSIKTTIPSTAASS